MQDIITSRGIMNSRTKFKEKMVTGLAVLTITAGLALNACDSTDKKEMPGAPASGTATKMSDSDLEKSIKAKLDSDAQLKAADKCRCTVLTKSGNDTEEWKRTLLQDN